MVSINIEGALKIDGWMMPEELQWLAENARDKKRILEIGCWRGRSTRAMVDNSDALIYCIDTFKGSALDNATAFRESLPVQGNEIYDAFRQNIKDVYPEQVFIIRALSAIALSLMAKEREEYFNMIFIDGAHDYTSVKSDIELSLLLLAPGGLLCGHDWPYVRSAVEDTLGVENVSNPVWSIWRRNN